MRSGRTGWVLVVAFLGMGIALWLTVPDAWIGQIFVGVAVFLAVVYLVMNRSTAKAQLPNGLQVSDLPGVTTQPSTWNSPGTPADIKVSTTTKTFTAGDDVGAAVMEALKQSGIDPAQGGTYDLNNVPAARDAVLKALSDHGVDIAHQIAAMTPGVPIEQSSEPVDAMQKLKQLKDAGLISDDEFEQNKKRILEGL
ncbi:MAG TPA: SHOCT domain-containing protein [Actinomycetota bacterium]|nr:SHOCT domain-containing protein [Actinomycetota bacterium]